MRITPVSGGSKSYCSAAVVAVAAGDVWKFDLRHPWVAFRRSLTSLYQSKDLNKRGEFVIVVESVVMQRISDGKDVISPAWRPTGTALAARVKVWKALLDIFTKIFWIKGMQRDPRGGFSASRLNLKFAVYKSRFHFNARYFYQTRILKYLKIIILLIQAPIYLLRV